MLDQKNNELTILMTSCKKYDDILSIHEKMFEKHWNDCQYKRMLVMDEITPGADYLKQYDDVLVCGKETGAKNHLRITMALEKIDTPYVMFLQEDMLLFDQVDNKKLLFVLNFVKKVNAGACRLEPFYGRDDYADPVVETDGKIVKSHKNTPYRVSYAPSIWNKEFLLDISRHFEFGADFERKGSELCEKRLEEIYAYRYLAYPYTNAIWRGKWNIQAVREIEYYECEPDFDKHPLMTARDTCKQGIMGLVFSCNPKAILKMQNRSEIGKKY